PGESVREPVPVLGERADAELDRSAHAGLQACEPDLLEDLARAPALAARRARTDPARDDAGPEVPASLVLFGPPAEQRGEVLPRRPGLPVELRGEVIDPALGEPAARVRVEIGVRVEAARPGRVIRPPDPERADPQPDVRLLPPDLAA